MKGIVAGDQIDRDQHVRCDVVIVGYQVIVGSFQVTVPAGTTRVTLPAEFAASLGRGAHPFEVLAIDASGNQTITEGEFVKP